MLCGIYIIYIYDITHYVLYYIATYNIIYIYIYTYIHIYIYIYTICISQKSFDTDVVDRLYQDASSRIEK